MKYGTPFLKQALVVSGAALNIAGHGALHGYPAVLLTQLQDSDLVTSQNDVSWIVSVAGIMGLVGTFLSPILMNRFGRQKTHLLSTIPAILGWAVFVLANSYTLLILARLLHGLSLGLRTPLAAILVAEYTDPKYRGAFLGTFAISLGLGIFLTHLWGGYLTWRMTAVVCSLFPLISMIVISISPESPSWLASKGRFDDATKAFEWLRGSSSEQKKELDILIHSQQMALTNNEKILHKKISRENSCKSILRSARDSIRHTVKILMMKEFFKPAIIAVNMFIIFEFGGAHIVPAYGNQILQEVLNKKTALEVHWQLTLVDFLRMMSAFIAIFLLKRFNRRTILFTSGFMTVLFKVLISSYMYLRQSQVIDLGLGEEVIPMVLLALYVLSFCLGLIPLTWVICGEIFPLAYRSLGSTFSTASLTPSFMLSMKTAPHLFKSVGVQGAFLVYAGILTLSLSVIYALLPETKDQTLKQIEDDFKGNSSSDAEVELKLMNHS